MNKNKQPSQANESNPSSSVFWGTIALALITMAIAAYFVVALPQENRNPVIYMGIGLFLSGVVAMIASLVLTLRGRQPQAVKINFFMLFILGLTAIGLFQGRALNASLTILIISIIMVRWLFPIESRRLYAMLIPVGFALLWVIEWVNPPWRIQVQAASVGPVGAVLFAVILVTLAVRQAWGSLSLRLKMGGIVAVLFLGMVAVAYTAYVGLQSLRYQLSNIYDFMLVPIVAINNADTALADAQINLINLAGAGKAEAAQNVAVIEASNHLAETVIQQYDTEWVTTVSPEFTQALREAGKLDLQQQELETLAKFHTEFDSYLAASDQYIQSIKAGRPTNDLAELSGQNLQASREALQKLIEINNAYADFSNLEAQSAHQSAITYGAVALGLALLIGLLLSSLIVSSITSRLNQLAQFAVGVQQGKLDQRLVTIWNDEITLLGSSFNEMASKLQESFSTLEGRVADRTRNLELAAEVGRSVSRVRALDIMLRDACDLILKEFNLYYVQVYLADASQTTLKLEAGTGNVGTQLVGRGHSLPLNTGSINGRAATEKRSVVISDTSKSATFRQNPLLPETRGEMAVPLIVADKVVGVLDMQSNSPGALTEEILPAFEALAGQMAIAVQNANLLAEAEQARAQVEAQARRLVREGWNQHLDAIHKPERIGYVFAHNQVTLLSENDESQHPEDGKALSIPIAVTGEQLGSLVVEINDETRREQTQELVNVVARQVGQQIENLRLLESADRYRFEAEHAASLQTVEGWKKYIESRPSEKIGFMYDKNEVRPNNGNTEDISNFAMPLMVRDEMIGKLSIKDLTQDDQGSVELVNEVAQRLSAHIENLRLFEETKQGQVELNKRAQQLAAVAEISTVSSQELDVDKLLKTVVHLTQREFDLYHAHVFVFNEITQTLEVIACGWKEGDSNEGTHETVSIPLDREQSLVARAARTGRSVIVNDVKSESGWLANPLLPDTASEMAVPLVIGDRVMGVLDVQSDRINAFTEEDANIQTTLASQVATAMQNARSFTQAQKQAEREAMLNVINQKIQSATTVDAVLQIAARELGHALGAPMTMAQLSMRDNKS